jgi:hypothetical protein
MGLITEKSQINLDLLQQLFKERGHGVELPHFWELLESAIHNPEMEVHQCSCGEVFFDSIENISSRPRDNLNNVLCKRCGKYEHESISALSYKKNLQLFELYYEFFQSINEKEKIFEKIKKIGYGLIPVNNYEEFDKGMLRHLKYVIDISNVISLSDLIPIPYNDTKQLFLSAKDKNQKILFEFLESEYFISLLMQHNIVLRKYLSSNMDFTERKLNPYYKDEKLFQSSLELDDPDFEKDIINSLKNYKIFYEKGIFPFTIMNLILIIRGNKYSEDPFKGLSYKIGKNKFNVTNLYHQIQYLIQQSELTHDFKNLLVKSYDNRLRNDYGHENYKILDNGEIYSKKYKTTRTLKEIKEKIDSIIDLEDQNYHLLRFKEKFENLKIETYELGIFNTFLGEDASFEPKLILFQFFYMNPNLKKLEITFEINQEKLIINLGRTYNHNLILSTRDIELVKVLRKYKELKILHSLVAPTFFKYKNIEYDGKEQIIDINGYEFYLLNDTEYEIVIPEEIISKIDEII